MKMQEQWQFLLLVSKAFEDEMAHWNMEHSGTIIFDVYVRDENMNINNVNKIQETKSKICFKFVSHFPFWAPGTVCKATTRQVAKCHAERFGPRTSKNPRRSLKVEQAQGKG